jgi:hypothetical protein
LIEATRKLIPSGSRIKKISFRKDYSEIFGDYSFSLLFS